MGTKGWTVFNNCFLTIVLMYRGAKRGGNSHLLLKLIVRHYLSFLWVWIKMDALCTLLYCCARYIFIVIGR